MALDREKIKARLESLDGKGANGFFKPQEGSQIIRILPDASGDPFRDFFLHYSIGQERSFLCPSRHEKKECAVCNFATKLWEEFKTSGDASVSEMAKKYFAKQRFFSPIVVRGKEKDGVKWWSYSKSIYDKLLRLTLDPDYDDITDLENGTDLILTYTSKGLQFPKMEFQPKRKPSSLCESLSSQECIELLENIPDISAEMVKKTPEEIKKILADEISNKTKVANENDSTETEKYGNNENGNLSRLSELSEKSLMGDKVDQMFNDLLEEN